ncbi:hypothetical protein [Pseudoalteromonas obscura]|uniref:hypothetical protein n=1 Tax=Pseudoalteromonas obscura TaxID=3048491 RepID=UPI0024DE61DB|nr:hypothetical protein [Pseudoalteromonas sp. P94(2023)]
MKIKLNKNLNDDKLALSQRRPKSSKHILITVITQVTHSVCALNYNLKLNSEPLCNQNRDPHVN